MAGLLEVVCVCVTNQLPWELPTGRTPERLGGLTGFTMDFPGLRFGPV